MSDLTVEVVITAMVMELYCYYEILVTCIIISNVLCANKK